ncbi:MAG: FAD-binding oxidoreductase [Verrucomicrobiales bacterium]|jgi:FAD/FMN-containing dehydrogenase
MKTSQTQVSRRDALKTAGAGGLGIVVGEALQSSNHSHAAIPPDPLAMSNDEWFAQRAWSVSANKVVPDASGNSQPVTSLAKRIHRSKSAAEIAAIVSSLPAATPIACVCGGHEASGTALIANHNAEILDLIELKKIDFERSGEDLLVTVGSGVVFRELVEAVKTQGGALPVGTGPGVGVAGYVTNGGLSSYFSRRLGLLGQRAVRMTVVTADGEIRKLTPQDALFTAMLGAGSALAIVVDMTFRVAAADTIKHAQQHVFGFEKGQQAVDFSRRAMQFMKEKVIPNDSVSLEVVVTGTKALVATVVFYDTFTGSTADFVKPLQDYAASQSLPSLATASWNSWYEAAAALWPVIAEQKGSPLATSYHCVGTTGIPEDNVLDFVADVVVGEAPLNEAGLSIVEIRTLGGEAQKGRRLPSGNCHHAFFVDLVTLYDAGSKSPAERQTIVDLTNRVVDQSRAVPGLSVDFSGTHSQPDDIGRSAVASEIFGSQAMATAVEQQKKKMDPNNRFRFHPFSKFLS